MIGSRRWPRTRGSSSSEKSEVSVQRRQRGEIDGLCVHLSSCSHSDFPSNEAIKVEGFVRGNSSSGFSRMSVRDWVSVRAAKSWPSLSSMPCEHVNTSTHTGHQERTQILNLSGLFEKNTQNAGMSCKPQRYLVSNCALGPFITAKPP